MVIKMKKQNKIPEGWEELKLEELFSLEYGKGLPERERKQGNVPVYGSNGVVGHHKESLVNSPGLIVGRKGTIGAVVYAKEDFFPIDTTYYVKLKRNSTHWKWLYYMLSYLNLSKLNSATGTPGLNRDLVYSQVEAVPKDYEEQKAIARILSSVDNQIELNERERRATERLKESVMVKLLENLSWKKVKLDEVIEEMGDGGTPSTKNKEYFKGDIPWVNIEDIKKEIYDTKRKLSKEGFSKCSAKLWEPGTLIFSFGASIGEVGIAKVKLCTKQGIAGIIPKKELINTEYLYYVLLHSAPKVRQIGSSMGSTIKEVRPPLLKKFIEVPLPYPEDPKKSLEEQKAIVKILSTIDQKLELEQQTKEKLEKLKKGLMQELLTGNKRVNVKRILEVKNG